MKQVLRVRRLTPADWLGLITAYRYLLQAGLTLRIRRSSLETWLREQAHQHDEGVDLLGEAGTAMRAARYVSIASRHPFIWARCLERSLALCLWLHAKKLHPLLRIGVRKDGTGLEAHAWVELGGKVLNDSPMVEQEYRGLPFLRKASS